MWYDWKDMGGTEMSKPQPTDTEILEFLLNQFSIHSRKMNGEHSWKFIHNYCMLNAVGQTAKDAIIACMEKAEDTKQFQEWLNE